MVKIAHFLPRIKADRYWPEEEDDLIVFGNFIFPLIQKVRFCLEYIKVNQLNLNSGVVIGLLNKQTDRQTQITTLYMRETNIHIPWDP